MNNIALQIFVEKNSCLSVEKNFKNSSLVTNKAREL